MAKRRKQQQNKASNAAAQQPGNGAQPANDGNNNQAVAPKQNPTNEEIKQQPVPVDNHKAANNNFPAENEDPTMVQPNFNISETVEVVHQQKTKNQAQTNNARFAPPKQQPAPMQAQKQGANWNQMNPAAMNAQYHKRQYQQATEPYGKQPVVTMHDLIDQEERQAASEQQMKAQQRQQQQQAVAPQQPAGDTGAQMGPRMVQQDVEEVDIDDEEGEEESEEEDTEEEGIYGPEDGQDDDLSDEIEDEHQWTAQAQSANAGQYQQPQYQGQPVQPAHYQGQPNDNQQFYSGTGATNQAAGQTQQPQQHYQQHAQGHQRSQAQQNADNIENRLHQYLTDMLINLYNGKATEEYRDHYAQVVTILDEQKKIQEQNNEKPPSITISSLQQLFQTKIENIVGTVRDKLQEDAKKDSLVQEIDVPADPSVVQDTTKKQGGEAPATTKQMKAKEYRGDLQKNFDEILSAVGDYFDLFKNNTEKLEALWLQLLEYVDVANTNQCRIFRQMHYSIYIRIVIKNKTITAIIKEAQRWNNTPHASKALKEHLDKIKQIENDSHPMIPETYENFNKRAALDFDLNEYTCTDFMQKQQQLERQQQQNQQQMRGAQTNTAADGTQQNQNVTSAEACKNQKVFHDCKQFQTHQRQFQHGKCMCRCFAKNCSMDHFGAISKTQRAAQQKRAAEKRQTKKTETIPAEQDYANEQVYNKNIDDLMDYIMKPQDGKKKKNKAQKKRKADDEEEVKSKNDSQSPAPLQYQTSTTSSGPESQSKISQQQPAMQSVAEQPPPQSSKQRKKETSSSQKHVEPAAEKVAAGGPKETRSTSPRKPQSERQRNSSKVQQDQPTQGKGQSSEALAPDAVSCKTEPLSSDDKLKSDQEFEAEIADFAKQLERSCQQKLANHAAKLRPNCEEQWILELKLRLKHLDNKKPVSSTQSTNSSHSNKTAPPASGHSRKH